MAIHIGPEANVTVSAPKDLDEEKILRVVRKRAQWIIGKQEIVSKHRPPDSLKEFVSGESFPYLGKTYRLKVVKSTGAGEGRCELINGRFLVKINEYLHDGNARSIVKQALMGWYLAHAAEKVRERVDFYSRQIGKRPEQIEVKEQKRRWGSCSRSGMVRFNWKIIMAPLSVLDYVVIHELCHLIYGHHSLRFWQRVESVIPDYRKRRARLKEFASQGHWE